MFTYVLTFLYVHFSSIGPLSFRLYEIGSANAY
jgi:hypothetical protein